MGFANSGVFNDHSSAGIYSYAPDTGQTRYERHLFSRLIF